MCLMPCPSHSSWFEQPPIWCMKKCWFLRGTLLLVKLRGKGLYRCPRRNVPDFGRVFLMLKYTDITQNTYVQILRCDIPVVCRLQCVYDGPHTYFYLCPKLNGYGDNGQRKVWSSGGSTHCTCQLTALSMLRRWVWYHMTGIQPTLAINRICTSFRVMT